MQLSICSEFAFLQIWMWFVLRACIRPLFVHRANKLNLICRGETARERNVTHIKKTLVLQCISPQQTRVNQTKLPARKSASKKMHSAQGTQRSYCSERGEEKEEREERKRSKGREGIPSLALHRGRSACRFY